MDRAGLEKLSLGALLDVADQAARGESEGFAVLQGVVEQRMARARSAKSRARGHRIVGDLSLAQGAPASVTRAHYEQAWALAEGLSGVSAVRLAAAASYSRFLAADQGRDAAVVFAQGAFDAALGQLDQLNTGTAEGARAFELIGEIRDALTAWQGDA